jgi:antirestriction protein ArdC
MPAPPVLQHTSQDRALYEPSFDRVTLPHPGLFVSADGYCATRFHELAHATGHWTRLNRPELGRGEFGSGTYSREELAAEIAAAFLCAECGINSQIDNHAAYVAS